MQSKILSVLNILLMVLVLIGEDFSSPINIATVVVAAASAIVSVVALILSFRKK